MIVCKIFENKVGGMCDMKRAYDLHGLINCANSMDHFVNHRVWENGLRFESGRSAPE